MDALDLEPEEELELVADIRRALSAPLGYFDLCQKWVMPLPRADRPARIKALAEKTLAIMYAWGT